MAKYLVQASYVGEGLKGLLKEGGSSRRAAVEKVVRGLGGTLESFYYAFGDYDVLGVVDFPDHAAATAFSLTVNATGAIKLKTTVLMTTEEVDEATKRSDIIKKIGKITRYETQGYVGKTKIIDIDKASDEETTDDRRKALDGGGEGDGGGDDTKGDDAAKD